MFKKMFQFIINLFSREKENNIVDHIEMINEEKIVVTPILTKELDTKIKPIPTQEEENKIIDEIVMETIENNNINKYKKIFSYNLPDRVIDELPMVIEKFNINNNYRLAHLLGQCSHESGNFLKIVENLNYSAEGLANTWPSRYAIRDANNKVIKPYKPTNFAKTLHRKPELIANHTYSNRNGNGSVESGEGWKYRGYGYLQTTGKYNICLLSEYVEEDLIKNPELIAIKYPLLSAGFYFKTNNLFSICDEGMSIATINKLTLKINGGLIGIKHRISETEKFYSLLKK